MCLAVPAKVVEVAGTRAKVALLGNSWEADLTLVDGAAVGEWVLVHAGFVIEKLSEKDARETLALLTGSEEALNE